ncbi:MAG: amidohydrolase [Clostridiales bacterium]|nr:amidohydrolase [Clostridiales bacterium]
MDKTLEFITKVIDEKAAMILDANDRIWEYAELAFKEYQSAKLLCDILEEEGFEVETGLAEIPTCFLGRYSVGSGKPVIGILGEYDALSALNQKAGSPVKEELEKGAPGHGCGHSALGAGALAGAIAVKEYLKTSQRDGTVIYFGCPAEEGAGSKQFMARAGLFDDVDFVYTWHPAPINKVDDTHNNAIMGANFHFEGISAHAGATPFLGRSALDACELMSVGCNYLREHMIDGARVHYAYIDAGGTAPNVVQDHATVRYEVRSPYVYQVKELFERVVRVAQGAVLMTDTKMTYELCMAFTECIPNLALAKIADEALTEVGAPVWEEADYQLAREFLESYNDLTKQSIRSELTQIYGADRIDAVWEKPLDGEIHHFNPEKIVSSCGSTDVGDVAAAVPTVQYRVATCCAGNVGHTWQMTAQTCSPLGHKGLLTAAKAIALGCIRTMDRPDVIEAAKAEVRARNGGHYTCPLPDYVKPPLDTY